ncbi:MAG: B12-binding domain-containing radical SAM protein [Steroidobacteraceae bacterium]
MRIAPELPSPQRAGRVQSRDTLLINPFYPKDPRASFGKHVLTPTLALTSVAGATPAHWRVRYWDENLLQGPPPRDPVPEVVGITVHLTFARRAYALADWYRAQGSRVILGGLHVLSCPEEALQHADAIAVGDGVQLWPQILGDIERGSLRPRYDADFSRQYAADPPPRRSILPREAFLTTSSVIATRGCHNRCGFCYLATDGLHMPYRMRQVQQVVEEISADRQPYTVFIDNNLGSRPGYLRALCGALRGLEIIWSAAVTVDVTDDPTLVHEMALAGCTGVFVGFESLNAVNLSDSRKRTPAPEDYARRVEVFHRYGIQVNGSFVLGFDHDRPEVFEQTVAWIEAHRLECATFHILTPYPGTPLFRQMQREGRILHRNWDLYDTGHVVFQPKHMSIEELERGYAWCYDELFSHRSIWKRRPADSRAVPAYLAMSYLYKRSNLFWHLLIRHRLTAALWRPLIEHSRRRHLKLRRRLETMTDSELRASQYVSGGV